MELGQRITFSLARSWISPADVAQIDGYLRGRGLDPQPFWKAWGVAPPEPSEPLRRESSSGVDGLFAIVQAIGLRVPDEQQKAEGVVFTPRPIVDYINRRVLAGLEASSRQDPIRILDPSCGAGVFLVDMLLKLTERFRVPAHHLVEEWLWGFEISPPLAAKAALILSALAYELSGSIPRQFRLYCGNALAPDFLQWAAGDVSFDAVVGNPPYVRIQNLSESMRRLIQRAWKLVRGDTDVYIAFFEMGLGRLRPGGRLGYITPKSYFTSYAGASLRELLVRGRHLAEIVDFGHHQVFEGVTTYAAITLCAKEGSDRVRYVRVRSAEDLARLDRLEAEVLDLGRFGRGRWAFPAPEVRERFAVLVRAPLRLRDVADIRVGIATLRDRVYLLPDALPDGDFLVVRRGDTTFRIERALCCKAIKASRIRSDRAQRLPVHYLIFPYRLVQRRAVLIPEEELATRYPGAYAYLLAHRGELQQRDRGRRAYEAWYAFGRTQGLTTTFGPKVLTPPMARRPNFVVASDPEATFYSGYGIFPHTPPYTDLGFLCRLLNSSAMQTYIESVSREYRGGWRSYSKTFLKDFPLPCLNEEDIPAISDRNAAERDAFLWAKYRASRPFALLG